MEIKTDLDGRPMVNLAGQPLPENVAGTIEPSGEPPAANASPTAAKISGEHKFADRFEEHRRRTKGQ